MLPSIPLDNNNIRKLKDRNQNGVAEPLGEDHVDGTRDVKETLASRFGDLKTPQVLRTNRRRVTSAKSLFR